MGLWTLSCKGNKISYSWPAPEWPFRGRGKALWRSSSVHPGSVRSFNGVAGSHSAKPNILINPLNNCFHAGATGTKQLLPCPIANLDALALACWRFGTPIVKPFTHHRWSFSSRAPQPLGGTGNAPQLKVRIKNGNLFSPRARAQFEYGERFQSGLNGQCGAGFHIDKALKRYSERARRSLKPFPGPRVSLYQSQYRPVPAFPKNTPPARGPRKSYARSPSHTHIGSFDPLRRWRASERATQMDIKFGARKLMGPIGEKMITFQRREVV